MSSNSYTIAAFPMEIKLLIMDDLDDVAAVCLGLVTRDFYATLKKRFQNTPKSLLPKLISWTVWAEGNPALDLYCPLYALLDDWMAAAGFKYYNLPSPKVQSRQAVFMKPEEYKNLLKDLRAVGEQACTLGKYSIWDRKSKGVVFRKFCDA